MTLASSATPGNLILSEPDRAVLTASAIDPGWAVSEWHAHSDGCDIRFPGLGGSTEGIVRYCLACRSAGRGKYAGPKGHSPQPTTVHDAGPGSPVLFVEGVLKSLCAGALAHAHGLPLTVVFINGADGIGRSTEKTVGALVAGRDTFVMYDADRETNPHVRAASVRVEGHLRRAGAVSVRFPAVPRVADDPATGLDDHLAQLPAEQRAGELGRLVRSSLPDPLDPASIAARLSGLDKALHPQVGRELADHLCRLGMPEAWTLNWRGALKTLCGLSHGDFDAIRKDALIRARDQARHHAQAEITEKGPEMPSPNEPMEVAASLLERFPQWRDQICIWRGDWYGWRGTHWAPAPVTQLTDLLRRQLRDAWYMSTVKGKEPTPTAWAPTSGKIDEVVAALASFLRRPDDQEPERGLFASNGRVGLDGTVTKHTPSVFNFAALPYAYDPAARCPEWDRFLASSLPDAEDQELLQEMAGYLLSGDTSQQKVFFLSGPPGAGKGTVLRTIQALMGADAFTSTSVKKIGTHFGMASLIGKSAAFVPDARFSFSPDSEALENILQISGEDVVPVPRKNQTDWVGQLGARLVMASNDLPVMSDVSGALYRRLVVIQFRQSFQGKEDFGLGAKLAPELAGILNWALEGYRRLTARGHFQQTASGYALAMEAKRESSPVTAFAEDMLVVDLESWVTVQDLYAAWVTYKDDQKFTRKEMTKPGLTRALCAAIPGLRAGLQRKVLGKNHKVLGGVRLRTKEELDA